MLNILLETFCHVDDFCNELLKQEQEYLLGLSATDIKNRTRRPGLILSEVMTIAIHFHQSGYNCFKHYYVFHVSVHLRKYFPKLCSYNRFVRLMQSLFVPMFFLVHCLLDVASENNFIDSTKISVCNNKRIPSHKVFKGIAKRGKTSMGWVFGFKLHIIINEIGQIVSFSLTPGNTDDRGVLPDLTKGVTGKLFGDRGYISKKWFEELLKNSLKLITRLKKGMKNQLMNLDEKLMLFKRSIIESVYNVLKGRSSFEHHRHRNLANFMVNIFGGLIAYQRNPNKPKSSLTKNDRKILSKISFQSDPKCPLIAA